MSIENLGLMELAGIAAFVGIAGGMVWMFKSTVKKPEYRSLATKRNPKPRYSKVRQAGSRSEVYDERLQCWTFLDTVETISEPFDYFGSGGRQNHHTHDHTAPSGEHSSSNTSSSWGGSCSSGSSSSSSSSSCSGSSDSD